VTVERYCFVLRVRPGQEAEYKRRHDEIWPELVEAIHAAGIRNFTIFLRGRDVIGFFECHDPDPAAALGRMEQLEVSARWDEHMRDVLEPSDGASPVEVWHLD
jgi:L-rhamnose mutarotase